jgi:hypothetical protein
MTKKHKNRALRTSSQVHQRLIFALPLFYTGASPDLSSAQRLILALTESWYHPRLQGQQDAEQGRRPGNVQACSVWAVSNQMEAAMYKSPWYHYTCDSFGSTADIRQRPGRRLGERALEI